MTDAEVESWVRDQLHQHHPPGPVIHVSDDVYFGLMAYTGRNKEALGAQVLLYRGNLLLGRSWVMPAPPGDDEAVVPGEGL